MTSPMRHMGIEPRGGSFLFSPIPRRPLGRHTVEYLEQRWRQRELEIAKKVNDYLATPEGRSHMTLRFAEVVDAALGRKP